LVSKKRDIFRESPILLGISMPDLRNTVRTILQQLYPFDIVEARGGDKVLKILRSEERAKNFFVIMDWEMLGVPGIDVAREIRGDKRMENLPIILMTSQIDQHHAGLAAEVGVNGCILKPFEAGSLLDKLIGIVSARANPPEHVKLIKKGESLANRGQFNKAMELFRESQKIRNSARILVHIGEVFEKVKKFVKAHDSYDEAVEVNPQYLKAYTTVSGLLLKLKKESSALPYLEKAVMISPYNPDRQTLLGSVYLHTGDEPNAEKAFEEAVRQDSEKAREVGERYLKAGKTKKAEGYFRDYLEQGRDYLLPDSQIHVYNRLGIALRRQGEWENAVLEYRRALEIDRHDAALHFNMGKAFIEGGKLYEARGWFEKALEIDPHFPEAAEELKRIGTV
jgi:tetratricopeptide (TPR) repeat protein